MTPETLLAWIHALQKNGRVVAIHTTADGGRWIGPNDKIEARDNDDCIYWVQASRAYIIPAAMCWLEAVTPGERPKP